MRSHDRPFVHRRRGVTSNLMSDLMMDHGDGVHPSIWFVLDGAPHIDLSASMVFPGLWKCLSANGASLLQHRDHGMTSSARGMDRWWHSPRSQIHRSGSDGRLLRSCGRPVPTAGVGTDQSMSMDVFDVMDSRSMHLSTNRRRSSCCANAEEVILHDLTCML